MKEPPVKVGDVIAGKYRVDSILGVGGMGVVVEAMHLELLERRAVKLMLPEALENGESVERFIREARASSRLKGEHVARVHDVARLDGGAPYMVMEYLEGTDLRTMLKQRGKIPLSEAVLYALQACEGLAEAHAAGIVHRDLKPANLFVTRRADGSPCVKLLDFGISKVTGSTDLEMTRTQAVLGSPSYMSPEQMRSARSVDARADIWSLGVILYRLTTGDAPFKADNITELVTRVLTSKASPPSRMSPELPAAFDEVLLRCLEKDLSVRYANVGELSAALAPFGPEEAAASAERVARLLAGASFGRGALSGPKSVQPAPRVSGDVWINSNNTQNTGPGGRTIAMRRWKVFGMIAGSVTLAAVGLGSLAVTLHLASMGPQAAPNPGPAEPAQTVQMVAAPPPETAAPSIQSASAAVAVATVAPAPPPASTGKTIPVVAVRTPSAPRAAKTSEPAPPPPAPPPTPPPAQTAAHRMFGSE